MKDMISDSSNYSSTKFSLKFVAQCRGRESTKTKKDEGWDGDDWQ